MNTSVSPQAAANGASIDQLVFRFAGIFVLLSLVLSQVHSIYWLWFTAFVGANMLQASFTGFCPLAAILGKLGVRSGAAFCPRGR
jgi:cation transport ATPase